MGVGHSVAKAASSCTFLCPRQKPVPVSYACLPMACTTGVLYLRSVSVLSFMFRLIHREEEQERECLASPRVSPRMPVEIHLVRGSGEAACAATRASVKAPAFLHARRCTVCAVLRAARMRL